MNADTDGLAGLQQMAGDATLLYYTTDEAKEGRDAFKEKRDPDFDQFPKIPISYFEYDIKSLASFISDDRWLFSFYKNLKGNLIYYHKDKVILSKLIEKE